MSTFVGYEVGNAAWMRAPFFQGIGAVEWAMVMALHREGLPPHVALAATLLYRVCNLWLPLAVALAAHGLGRVPSFLGARRSGARPTAATEAPAVSTGGDD